MGSKRWKHDELELARRLGGERVPVPGRQRGYAPDILHPWLSIEVKSRKSAMKLIAQMMDQAVAAEVFSKRRDGKTRLPVGIYHVMGTRFDKAIVFMRMKDFEDWFVSLKAKVDGAGD